MTATCTACATSTRTCALCDTSICAEHTQRWHPLITARQLITTTVSTATRAPSMLGEVLLQPIAQVDYCQSCRDLVSERRQTEQLKVALGILLVLVIVVGLPMFFMFG